METILCIDTPVQMISCTDTNGKITPDAVPFPRQEWELVTIQIDKVILTDQERGSLGANFICTASLYGTQLTFRLRYNYYAHKWLMAALAVKIRHHPE